MYKESAFDLIGVTVHTFVVLEHYPVSGPKKENGNESIINIDGIIFHLAF